MEIIFKLVVWVLTPSSPPWGNPDKGSTRVFLDEAPSFLFAASIIYMAYDKLHFKEIDHLLLNLLLGLSPLIIVFIGFVVGLRLKYPVSHQVTVWLYRYFSINLSLVLLWGMRLKNINPLNTPIYSNFYFAIYLSATILMIVSSVMLFYGIEGSIKPKLISITRMFVLYFLFLSFLLFVIGLPEPTQIDSWWNPPPIIALTSSLS